MARKAELKYIIKAEAEVEKARKQVEKLAKQVERANAQAKVSGGWKQLGSGIDNLNSKMLGAAKVAGTALVGGLIAGTGAALKMAQESEVADKRIGAITKSMNLYGKKTGEVNQRLYDYADKTSRATGIDDGIIKSTQAKLLTFKELAITADKSGGAFDRATKAAVDMASAGFGTAEGNAVQLGKALNDPIKGITALTKSGITFTAKEKEKIEALVKSGKAGKAQEMILKAIETQVGGTAEATSSATGRMKVGFLEMVEGVGLKLLPTFNKMVNTVTDKVIPAVEKFINTFDWSQFKVVGDAIKDAIDGVKKALAEASGGKKFDLAQVLTDAIPIIAAAIDMFGKAIAFVVKHWKLFAGILAAAGVIGIIMKVVAVVQTVISVFSAVSGAIAAVSAAFPAIGAAIGVLTGPIGWIILAIVAVVGILVLLWKKCDWFRNGVIAIWTAVKNFTIAAFDAIVAFFKKWGKTILILLTGPVGIAVALIVKNWDKIKAGAISAFNIVKSAFRNVWDWITGRANTIGGVFRKAFSGIASIVSNAFSGVKSAVRSAWNVIANFVNPKLTTVNKGLATLKLPWRVPKMPVMHTGGYVKATTPHLLQKGEFVLRKSAVEQLNEGSGTGASVTIEMNNTFTVASNVDVDRIAETIARQMRVELRAAGIG